MVSDILGVAVIMSAGILAGVFVAVAASVFPVLMRMPVASYIEIHRSLGRGYHPMMPLIVNGGILGALILAVIAPTAAARALFAVGALLLGGTVLVSQFRNVPINRVLAAADVAAPPPDWEALRRRWRGWHALRTAIALAALTDNAMALALLH